MNLLILRSLLLISVLLSTSFMSSRAIDCKGGDGGTKFARTIVVDKFARGSMKTIQAAINSVPSNNDRWIKIQIHPGLYQEQVTVPKNKPCIFLQGTRSEDTIISYDAHNSTDTSATFTSEAENFVAIQITFKNSFNHLVDPGASQEKKQAVAALVSGDKSFFFSCSFLGVQDTLWDFSGRHFFKKCSIEGSTDFIFGNAQSVYEDFDIKTTSGEVLPAETSGFITAQARSSQNDPGGFVFRGGRIHGSVPVDLGRAYGPYSRVIFDRTYMDAVIKPEGWSAWNYVGKESNFVYAEVNCTGPGAETSQRVKWEKKLDFNDMNQYTKSSFIDQDGWLAKLPSVHV